MILRICGNCGKEFYARPYKIKNGRAKFCSHACNASFNHKGKPKPKSRQNIAIATKARQGLPAWNKLPTIDIPCQQCGTIFQVKNYRKNIAVFCSQHCHYLFNKTITGKSHPLFKRQPRICEWCKKEVWVIPSKLDEFRFCSRSCLGSWVSRHIHKPTLPEVLVSTALKELKLDFESEYRIGTYSCDFALSRYKLVIEVDGEYWHSTPRRKRLDKTKDIFLKNEGWSVLRFAERDIYKNLTLCLVRLNKFIKLIPPQTSPKNTHLQFE